MDELIKRIENLRTFRSGERRAPHKPLLILLAISRLQRGQTELSFAEVESALLPLLRIYAPPVSRKHQPELPYWHLQSDDLWEVSDADTLPRQMGGFPRIGALRKTKGGFPKKVADTLTQNPALTEEVVNILLNEHFPSSIHDDLLAQVGIELQQTDQIKERNIEYSIKKRRDPAFRDNVLRAYEYRCAVTGFRAALGGTYFGCEAAHVQWHAYGGPDEVSNGICLEPTVHKLFDAGAWTLTDDRRIIVSRDYTGTETAVIRLREHHGKPLQEPIKGEPTVSVEYIRWHRESKHGGVFRTPAMEL